jgi:predicted dehydrogenase
MKKTNVIIVGCGNISPVYFQAARRMHNLNLLGCADMLLDRAESRAVEFETEAFTVEQALAHPDADILINLTIPKAHGEIGIAALEAGKSVYNEKPIALSRVEAAQMAALCTAKGLRFGGAPDTFLGAGIQTCRALIDAGAIGEPIGATAFMMCHGHESWHPDPAFYYQPGGGPMFDMGPYYLTALIALIGPVARVTGMTRVTFPEREITSKPKFGEKITVRVPTHVSGLLEFTSGASATIIQSFDVWHHSMPNIEIYGSEGSLRVPDPNSFGGPVLIAKAGSREWTEVPLSHGYAKQSRGLGVADMGAAMHAGRAHRANGAVCAHVLDIMHAIHDAATESRHVMLTTTCERPAALPADLADGEIDW